jgi:pimeloyl-ACP methyl ester carboxylesterase
VDAWLAAYAMDLTASEEAAQTLSALRACYDRLVGEGVNLSAYRSAVSAEDLQDLMIALGYERWNIFGVSYGSRLALTAMRDTPEHIRSVVLDSTSPVTGNDANFAADIEYGLNRLFAGCAADPACDAAYSNLEETFYALVHQLNDAPVALRPIDPATGEAFDVVLTGDRLVLAMRQALIRTDFIPFLPLTIASAAGGDYALLTAGFATLPQNINFAWGMTYSVWCGEEVPFVTPQVLAQATANVRPEIRDAGLTLVTQFHLDVCDFWHVAPPAALESEPVASDIPTLILAGEYDPATPPYYGEEAAQTLSRSQFFEFRGFGHSLLRAQSAETARPRCAMQLVSAFLDDPLAELDGSCVEDLPAPRFP